MPLDTHHVSTFLRLDGLDHPIRRGRDDFESAGIIQGLHVMTVDHAVETATAHRVDRAVPMLVRGLEMVGEVLIELATRMETHHLHAETDAEDRQIRCGILESVEQFDFECLPIRGDERRGGMDRLVESGGVRICLLYTSPSPRDQRGSRMPSSA